MLDYFQMLNWIVIPKWSPESNNNNPRIILYFYPMHFFIDTLIRLQLKFIFTIVTAVPKCSGVERLSFSFFNRGRKNPIKPSSLTAIFEPLLISSSILQYSLDSLLLLGKFLKFSWLCIIKEVSVVKIVIPLQSVNCADDSVSSVASTACKHLRLIHLWFKRIT